MEYTRRTRRNVAHQLGKIVTPEPRIDMGNCYYCKLPVLAGVGQSIRHVREVLTSKVDGHEISNTAHPTHKRCRKGVDNHP